MMKTAPTLPFGKHAGQELRTIPTDYLRWALSACKLSSGLRSALAGELEGRGIEAPQQAPPRKVAPCRDHPTAGVRYAWQTDSAGRRHVRASCGGCDRFLCFAPAVEPYTTQADLAAQEVPCGR
jgi:hypothetical protein